MQITKTYSWTRRDFSYDAKCEHCEHITTNNSGYDDSNYYNNVVPDKQCPKCNESSNSKGSNVPKTITIPKHDPNLSF